jgi:hypothetical protein
LQDAQFSVSDVVGANSEEAAFSDVETGFYESGETDEEVAIDYALQVREGTRANSDPAVAGGLIASTRETMRTLSEPAIEEIRSGRIARSEVDALERVHDTELAKVKWYAGGFAIVFLRRRDVPLRKLAKRFPAQLGWLERVLDYIRADQGI